MILLKNVRSGCVRDRDRGRSRSGLSGFVSTECSPTRSLLASKLPDPVGVVAAIREQASYSSNGQGTRPIHWPLLFDVQALSCASGEAARFTHQNMGDWHEVHSCLDCASRH